MRLKVLISSLMILTIGSHVALAKGPANKIVITGPGVEGELEITDQETLNSLSMTRLEDFLHGQLENPPLVGDEGYEMTRYFETGPEQFRPFDKVVYYPVPEEGRGYIFYDGIIDGSSEYDDHWFNATPEGYATMQRILSGDEIASYLILSDDKNSIQLISPETLAAVGSVDFPDEWNSIAHILADANGETLFFSANQGSSTQQFALDFTSNTRCWLSNSEQVITTSLNGQEIFLASKSNNSEQARFEVFDAQTWVEKLSVAVPDTMPQQQFYPSPDGRWIYVLSYDERSATLYQWDMMTHEFTSEMALPRHPPGAVYQGEWDSEWLSFYLTNGERVIATAAGYIFQDFAPDFPVMPGSTWPEMAGIRAGQIYFYYPHPQGENTGGFFQVEVGQEEVTHYHPDIAFEQLILGGQHLYGIWAQGDNEAVELLAIDTQDPESIISRTLIPEHGSLSYARLNPELVPQGNIIVEDC